VTPALHTPLMSVTNAISSVIVVGALLAVGVRWRPTIGAGRALRLHRADLCVGQHLRRLPCHPAHAGDVQEEGEVTGRGIHEREPRGLLYLVSGVLFILALRGLSQPGIVPPGQFLRHGRHDHRHRDDAGARIRRGRHPRLDPRDRPCHRRRHRRRHRAHRR
jgi:hypothetical protein